MPIETLAQPPTTSNAQMPSRIQPIDPLDMPADCMYGWLGNLTQRMDSPLSWGYSSCLTIFAGQGVNIRPGGQTLVRPTLYTCLLGGPGSGKSKSMERARALLQPSPEVVRTSTPGSDRGLVNLISGRQKKDDPLPMETMSVVLIQDELRDMFAKLNIQGSSLAPLLCKFFYEDEGGSADKTGVHETKVRLSLLGALAISDSTEFQSIFGSGTTAGLYDRFLFVPGPVGWSWDHWWTAPKIKPRTPIEVTIAKPEFDRIAAWAADGEAVGIKRGRLAELAYRVAFISSSANGDARVTDASITAALNFAAWQANVRAKYGPGVALNADAVATSAILDGMSEFAKKTRVGSFVNWRDFINNKNFNRKFGSPLVTRTREALISGGQLIAEMDAKDKRTGCYILAHNKFSKEESI